MKEDYRIFVEGIADECFLRQLIGYHWGQVKEDSIIITGGECMKIHLKISSCLGKVGCL